MISIIIPTLNEENYVGLLLGDLAKQTYKNFEIIIVDGNSTDKTRNVALVYKNKTKLKFINKKKKGISYQRNIGAKIAKYENLFFLDADSRINKHFIQELIDNLQKKNFNIAAIKTLNYDEDINHNIFFKVIDITFSILQYIKPYGLGAAIFCEKKLHNEINGFNENINFGENFDYISKASKLGKFSYLRNIKVYTSTRRFEKKGTRKTMKIWLKSFFLHLFFKRYLIISNYD